MFANKSPCCLKADILSWIMFDAVWHSPNHADPVSNASGQLPGALAKLYQAMMSVQKGITQWKRCLGMVVST
jgi:hypothetical protein